MAKTVGIWLVVLGHVQPDISTPYMNMVFSFHMPLFFFLSGVLDKYKPFKEYFRSAVRSLLVPYVLLYLISFIWWTPPDTSFDARFIKPLLGMLMAEGNGTSFATMINPPLWFLVALFFVKTIHWAFKSIAKENDLILLVGTALSVAATFFIIREKVNLFFSIDSAIMGYLFFCAGHLFKRHLEAGSSRLSPNTLRNSLVKMAVALLAAFAVVYFSKLNGRVDLNAVSYGSDFLWFYLNAFAGIIMVIALSLFYNKEFRPVGIISAGTVLILPWHVPLMTLLVACLKQFFDFHHNALVYAIPISALTVLALILPVWLVQKYFPFLVGGRKIKPTLAHS